MSKIIVLKSGSAMQEIANENINALAVKIDTVGSYLSELQNVNLKLTLRKNGKNTKVIFDDTLKTQFLINQSRFDGLDELLNELKILYIPFETTLNLTKGDSLVLECKNNMFSAVATPVQLIIEGVPSIGVTQFIPVVERIQLDSTLTEHNLQLGSHVSRVILNTAFSNNDISSVYIKSDKVDAEFLPSALATQFSNALVPVVTAIDLPFNLVNDKQLQNDLSLKIKFTVATAGREIYVIRNIHTPEIVNRFVRKTEEHNQKNLMQIKSVKTLDCACKN